MVHELPGRNAVNTIFGTDVIWSNVQIAHVVIVCRQVMPNPSYIVIHASFERTSSDLVFVIVTVFVSQCRNILLCLDNRLFVLK